MLNSVLRLGAAAGFWIPADCGNCELPQLKADLPEITRHMLLIAGGLALTLSRCSLKNVDSEYPNAHELYLVLRHDLRRAGSTSASAELMLETLHEVAERLDPVSRSSLRALLEARRKYDLRQSAARANDGALASMNFPAVGGLPGAMAQDPVR